MWRALIVVPMVASMVATTEAPRVVVLPLPPTGSVSVRVLEADGTPIDPRYLDPPAVELTAFERPPKTGIEPTEGRKLSQCEAPLGADGVARFEHIALGRFLRARLVHAQDAHEFAGPTTEQPHVEATIRRSVRAIVLAGRVIGPDAAPFAERRLRISFRYAGVCGSCACRTDADGRFRHAVDWLRPGQPATVGVIAQRGEGEEPWSVEVLPRTLLSGTNELGDLRLQPFRLLLAGRLARDAGIPETGEPVFEVWRHDGSRWDRDAELQPAWPAPDRFEVRGACADGASLRLVVSKGRWLSAAPIECKVPAHDIEVRLEAAPSIRATFLTDERMPVDRLHFIASVEDLLRWRGAPAAIFGLERIQPPEPRDWRAGAMQRRVTGGPTSLDGRLQCTWHGLTAGTYRITVRCPGADRPVVVVDDLRVDSGPCADPRLLDIDLRAHVRSLRVRVIDGDGEPVRDSDAFVLVDSGMCWRGFDLRSGIVDLVTAGPVDLWVVAPARRIGRVAAAAADCTVALQRAPLARVAVRLPQPVPEGMHLELTLRPEMDLPTREFVELDDKPGTKLEQLFEVTARVGADGCAAVPVRLSGKHAVYCRLSRGPQHDEILRLLERISYVAIEPRMVELGAEGGAIAVRVEPDAFAAQLRKLWK